MFKIIIEKECSCFKKSNMVNNEAIKSKDGALLKGIEMVNTMNDDFCAKHNFKLLEVENDFVITVNDSSEGGCCGGGCGTHSH
ncbi:MAG: hypothetical protein L3I99_06275 [Sulfurimonas sp.]|nr:hypothetical protein [Sulfurimonas sp.]